MKIVSQSYASKAANKATTILIIVALICVCSTANAGGWKSTVSNDFTQISNLLGWKFKLPWNNTYTTTDYVLGNGYLELQMAQTDKGGSVLSPKFLVEGAIRVTVRHYMHKGSSVFLGNIELRDETSNPSTYSSSANVIHLGFQNSSYPPDYACSAFNIPRLQDSAGCIPVTYQARTTSSSLYDHWITTVILYNPKTGRLTIDYENDQNIDFEGTISTNNRFTPSRIAFSGFGWYTGHFHRIDFVKIESIN